MNSVSSPHQTMKFLPPAAALQLTQKSSKAVENAAAFAEVGLCENHVGVVEAASLQHSYGFRLPLRASLVLKSWFLVARRLWLPQSMRAVT